MSLQFVTVSILSGTLTHGCVGVESVGHLTILSEVSSVEPRTLNARIKFISLGGRVKLTNSPNLELSPVFESSCKI